MKKHAFIIDSDTTDLHGVQTDVDNFVEFLKSPCGGEWRDNEISHISQHCSLTDDLGLLCDLHFIKEFNYDYIIVFYSGHGAIVNGKQVIYLNNGIQTETANLCNLAKKQLTILDCCRKEETSNFSEIIKESVAASRATIYHTRSYYEFLIAQAKEQQNFLFACSSNEFATDTANGAAYLNALFSAAYSIAKEESCSWLSVREVHDIATASVKRNPYLSQNPDYYIPKLRKNESLPFSINPTSYINP